MPAEYRALVAKVTSFTDALATRQAAAMVCRRGCDGCCHAWLAPCPVEADTLRAALATLTPEARGAIAARGRLELAREARAESEPRCAMLEPDGGCAVYEARPLVCRTQGHALRYPAGVIPATAIRKRVSGGGEVTACGLNFVEGMPAASDTLDAERSDQLLALVNLRYCAPRGIDPQARTAISALAAECDVLASPETEDEGSPTGSARGDDAV